MAVQRATLCALRDSSAYASAAEPAHGPSRPIVGGGAYIVNGGWCRSSQPCRFRNRGIGQGLTDQIGFRNGMLIMVWRNAAQP